MLYEQYYQKTLKRAAVLAAIKRFRVLIICVTLAIVAALAAFMGVFGMAYSSTECPSEIVYGETLDYAVKSLFTKTSYEYTSAGEDEWSADFPELAGDYEVRSVSKSIFGTARHGEAYAFTILPKELTVRCVDKAVYGENPAVTAELAEGDSLQCSSFTFGDKTATKTTAEADKDAITIYNANGTDVTSNYIITTVKTDISITQRTIEITLDDASKTYDGTALTSLSYTITGGSLAYEDDITLSGGASVTAAGSAENGADVEICTDGGADVTQNYSIKVVAGTLTVTKRTVYVTTADGEWTYDGAGHYSDGYTVSGASSDTGLLNGHTMGAIGYTTVCDAGEYANSLELSVSDGQGGDVTSNYNIVKTEGTLTVKKRAITVTTDDLTAVYDGFAHNDTDYNITGALADGQEHGLKDFTQITDAGSCENAIGIAIYGGETDVTANYDITYVFGTLTITKRQVYVTTAGTGFEYDGTTHSYPYFGIDTGGGYYKFADGQDLQVAASTGVKNVSEGRVQNVFTEYYVRDSEGNDVTANYDLLFHYGYLYVIARNVTFVTGSIYEEYDGGEHSCTSFTVSGRGLADGQTEKVAAYAAITDVGERENELIINIYSGDEDVTENYNITYDNGTLSVYKRDITITASSSSKYYDGTALTCDRYSVDRLVSGHVLSADTAGTITDAGTEENGIVEGSVIITDANGGYMNGNYSLSYATGELTVIPRPVAIQTNSQSWVYDGETHSHAVYSVLSYISSGSTAGESNYGILSGHTHEASGAAYVTNAADSRSGNNIFTVAVYDGVRNVTDNYDITYKYGTLTVTRRPVTLKTGTESWTYDGDDHSNTECEVDAGSQYDIVSGHGITVVYCTWVNTVADSGDNVLTAEIYDGSGNDATDNYDLTYIYGALTITKRSITVKTSDAEWTYNDAEYSSPSYGYVLNLADGQDLSCVTYTTIKNAGSCDNVVTYNVIDGGGDVTENYTISYIYGTLTVNLRGIGVYAGSASKVYDGTALTCSNVTWYNVVEGHTATAETDGSITEAGTAENRVITDSIKIVDADGNDVTANYTVVGNVKGTLTVYAALLTITAGSASKVYDGTALTCSEYSFDGLWDTAHVVTAVTEGSRTAAGDATNTIYSYEITDEYGNALPDYYYLVQTEDGKLTVTKRSVTITTGNANFPYDGQYHSYGEFSVSDATSADDGLLSGHAAELDNADSYVAAGTHKNQLTVHIWLGTTDVTSNYNITYVYGTITIEKLAITVTTGGCSWLYDGLAHSYASYALSDTTPLASGHTLSASGFASITEAGYRDNTVTIKVYSGTADVTSNYEITYEYGRLEVYNPLELDAGASFEYTAPTFGYYTFTLQSGSVTLTINGAEYTLTVDGETKLIELDQDEVVTVTADDYSEVTVSYSDSDDDDRPVLIIKPVDDVKTYDGTALEAGSTVEGTDGYEFAFKELENSGYTYYVETSGSQTDIGTSYSTITKFILYDAGGNNVTDDYKIVFNRGTLTVTENVVITVHLYAISKTYDGTPLSYGEDDYYWEIDGVYYEDTGYNVVIEGLSDLSMTDCGTLDEEMLSLLTITVYDVNTGVDVTKGVAVDIDKSDLLTVYKRNITITAASAQKQYDGTALTDNGYRISGSGVAESDKIYVTISGSLTDVGETMNTIVSVTIYNSAGVIVNSNYNITKVNGTLTVTG